MRGEEDREGREAYRGGRGDCKLCVVMLNCQDISV